MAPSCKPRAYNQAILLALITLILGTLPYPALAAADPNGEPERSHWRQRGAEEVIVSSPAPMTGASTTASSSNALLESAAPTITLPQNAPDGVFQKLPSGWAQQCAAVHLISPGETLGVIAQLYNVSLPALITANGLTPGGPYDLKYGGFLCIPRLSLDLIFPRLELNAAIYRNRLTVWGKGIPVPINLLVRVRTTPGGAFKKVGVLKVSPNGVFQKHVTLPKSQWNSKFYEICLKEASYGLTVCTRLDYRWLPNLPKSSFPLFLNQSGR